MIRFSYARPEGVAQAVQAIGAEGAKFIAGGTNLVDLLKYNVETPTTLVDVARVAGLDHVRALRRPRLQDEAMVGVVALLELIRVSRRPRPVENFTVADARIRVGIIWIKFDRAFE